MESCPEWLKVKDNSSKNWMDLDNKMTETVALARAIGHKYFLIPDDPTMQERAEQVEKLCFGIMNTMVYIINKICFAPNNTKSDGNDFDPQYARSVCYQVRGVTGRTFHHGGLTAYICRLSSLR